jgi:hypothetical protein
MSSWPHMAAPVREHLVAQFKAFPDFRAMEIDDVD